MAYTPWKVYLGDQMRAQFGSPLDVARYVLWLRAATGDQWPVQVFYHTYRRLLLFDSSTSPAYSVLDTATTSASWVARADELNKQLDAKAAERDRRARARRAAAEIERSRSESGS